MSETAIPRRDKFRIGIVCLPNFNALTTMAFIDPFRAANYVAGRHLYGWDLLSLSESTVAASNGASFSGLRKFSMAEPCNMIVVSASWQPEAYQSRAFFKWLRDCKMRGAVLGGLDTGPFVLGFAGLLEGTAVSVHYEHHTSLVEFFPGIDISNQPFSLGGNCFTCCGGLASADMSLEIVRTHHGSPLADAAARYIFHRITPTGLAVTEGSETLAAQDKPRTLRDAVELMKKRIEDPLSIPQLARKIGTSQRNLERLFEQFTGRTPHGYYVNLRLERARGLVTQTNLSVMEIAVACGFVAPSHFSRAYKKRYHIRPIDDRMVSKIPFQYREAPTHATIDLE